MPGPLVDRQTAERIARAVLARFHSCSPEQVPVEAPDVDAVLRELMLGATGRYPAGTLGPGDCGELRVAMMIRGDRIVVDFGKDLSWIGLLAQEADTWASELQRMARQLRAQVARARPGS